MCRLLISLLAPCCSAETQTVFISASFRSSFRFTQMFMCGQKVLQKVLKLLISCSGLALWRGKAQTEAECSLCRLLFIKKCGRKGKRERRAGGRGLCESGKYWQRPRQQGLQRQTEISQPNLARYYSQGDECWCENSCSSRR